MVIATSAGDVYESEFHQTINEPMTWPEAKEPTKITVHPAPRSSGSDWVDEGNTPAEDLAAERVRAGVGTRPDTAFATFAEKFPGAVGEAALEPIRKIRGLLGALERQYNPQAGDVISDSDVDPTKLSSSVALDLVSFGIGSGGTTARSVTAGMLKKEPTFALKQPEFPDLPANTAEWGKFEEPKPWNYDKSLEQIPWTEADEVWHIHPPIAKPSYLTDKEWSAYNLQEQKKILDDEKWFGQHQPKPPGEVIGKEDETSAVLKSIEEILNNPDSSVKIKKIPIKIGKPEPSLADKLTSPWEDMMDDMHMAIETMTAKVKASIYKTKIARELKPLSWEDVTLTHTVQSSASSYVSPEHMQVLGFNPNALLFKGGYDKYPKDFKIPDVSKKKLEKGFFLTDDPKIADHYGAGVTTYVARPTNAMSIDWTATTGYSYYNPVGMHGLIEAAKSKGADLLVVKNIGDIGGKQNQFIVLNESILRAPHAKFSPEHLHMNHIMMGIGGGVMAPVLLLSTNDPSKAGEIEKLPIVHTPPKDK